MLPLYALWNRFSVGVVNLLSCKKQFIVLLFGLSLDLKVSSGVKVFYKMHEGSLSFWLYKAYWDDVCRCTQPGRSHLEHIYPPHTRPRAQSHHELEKVFSTKVGQIIHHCKGGLMQKNCYIVIPI